MTSLIGIAPLQSPEFSGDSSISGNLDLGPKTDTSTPTTYDVSSSVVSGSTEIVITGEFTYQSGNGYPISGSGISSGCQVIGGVYDSTSGNTTLTLSSPTTAAITGTSTVSISVIPGTTLQFYSNGSTNYDSQILSVGGNDGDLGGILTISSDTFNVSTTNDMTFNGANFNVDTVLNSKLDLNLGQKTEVNYPSLNFYSSGNNVIDSSITASGGTTTADGGSLTLTSDAFNINSTMNIMSPSFNLGLNQTKVGAAFVNFFSNGNNNYADATIQSYGGTTGQAGGGTFTITSGNLTVASPYVDLTSAVDGVMVPSTTVSDKATDKAVNMTSLSSFLQTIGTYIAVANSTNITTLSCSTQTITAPSNGILLCYGTSFSPTTNLTNMVLSSSYSVNPVNCDAISGWNNSYVAGSQFINKGDTAVITFTGNASASAPSFAVFGYVIFTPTL